MRLEEKIHEKMALENVPIECVEHEPVYTNPAMAKALGIKGTQTVKSLVLKSKEGKFAVLVLPGDKKMG